MKLVFNLEIMLVIAKHNCIMQFIVQASHFCYGIRWKRVPCQDNFDGLLFQSKERYASQQELLDIAAEYRKRKIPLDVTPEDKLTILMTRIIDANNDSNFRHLRVIEERGDDLNEAIMNASTDRSTLGPRIYEMKHALITYMNALWDSIDVLHALRYGDAELLSDNEKMLDIISIMTDEVKGQIGLAEHMSEVLASGLEVMQTIYNNQLQALNNRLSLVITYLTIVGTAVLVPNTLATLLGVAVFDIGPGDLWWYILLMVAATVGSTFGIWWWLKNRGWLPKKPEC